VKLQAQERRENFMRPFKFLLQHHFNPLHVYCRLRSCGLCKERAMRFSRTYDRLLFSRLPL
jgi:hypothetical protein